MKKVILVALVALSLVLTACQSQIPLPSTQSTPASPQAANAPTAIAAPAENNTTLTGRLLSIDGGEPYANTAVQIAAVYRNGDSAAFALDTARSPGSYTNEEGYFVIPGVIYKEFVIVIGDPETNYYIVSDGPDTARVYKSEMGKVQELGDLKIDFEP